MEGVESASKLVTNDEYHDSEDTEGGSEGSSSEKPQTNSEYRGQGKYMITMSFLEDGGYFDVPIQVASAQLGLGVTTLKRVCRANSMSRWPFRKRKSLGKLIDRTKQVLEDGTGQNHMQKLAALQVLEKQRQVMRSSQSQDMDDKIKIYRQAVFKLDHVERKRVFLSGLVVTTVAYLDSFNFYFGSFQTWENKFLPQDVIRCQSHASKLLFGIEQLLQWQIYITELFLGALQLHMMMSRH